MLAVAREHDLVASNIETNLPVAKCVDKASRGVGYIGRLDGKGESHARRFGRGVVPRLEIALCRDILSYTQSHATERIAVSVSLPVIVRTIVVTHETVSGVVCATNLNVHPIVRDGLVRVAVRARRHIYIEYGTCSSLDRYNRTSNRNIVCRRAHIARHSVELELAADRHTRQTLGHSISTVA